MSTSDPSWIKDDGEQPESASSSRPVSEDPDGCSKIESKSNLDGDKKEAQETSHKNLPNSGQPCPEPEEDDDGFKTPTSLEHRVPVTTVCPPAPRKPKLTRGVSKRRKVSSKTFLPRLVRPEEVDSAFSQPSQEDDVCRKIKKARRDDEDHDQRAA